MMKVIVPASAVPALSNKLAFEYEAHVAEPVIEVEASAQGERYSLGVVHIDVENEAGEIARFWVDVRTVNGRPSLIVRTKVGKDRNTQRESRVQGSFNIL